MSKSLTDTIKQPLPGRETYKRTEWIFWPSEASCVKPDGEIIGRCLRRTFYTWKGIPESNPVPELVKTMGEIGNFLEYETRKEFLTKKIYPMEDNKKKNRKFRVGLVDDIILSGEVDVIVGTEEEHCGVEVKSYNNSTYKTEAKPKDPHLLQTFLYLVYYQPQQPYFLIRYLPSPISKWATKQVYHRIDCLQINREIHPIINGGVDRTIKLSSIIRRWKEAKYCIKENLLPIKEFKRSSPSCQQCNYKTFCKADKEGTTIGEKYDSEGLPTSIS